MERFINNPGLEHLSRQIFNYLDWGSLRSCRLVSKTIKQYVYFILQKRYVNAKYEIANRRTLIQNNFPEWTQVYKYFEGNKRRVKWYMCLLSEYASKLRHTDLKWTPIFYAISIGDVEILKFLNPSPASFGGYNYRCAWTQITSQLTPLQFACAHGNLDVIRYFLDWSLEKGIKVEERDTLRDGFLPRFALLHHHYYDIFQLFLNHPRCENMLRLVFEEECNFDHILSKADLVNLMLKNAKTLLGFDCFVAKSNTLLHYACIHGNTELVKDIIKHDSDSCLYETNWQGETPTQIAIRKGHTEIVNLIDTAMGLPALAQVDL